MLRTPPLHVWLQQRHAPTCEVWWSRPPSREQLRRGVAAAARSGPAAGRRLTETT